MLNEVGKTKPPTQIEAMNLLIVNFALETGFILTDWDDDLDKYNLHWSYSFDRKMLEDFARLPARIDFDEDMTLTFKLSLKPERQICVSTAICGDLFMISAYLIESSVMISTRSVIVPASRYVITRKLNISNLAINFCHLRELSIKVKDEIFLPLRSNIFIESSLTMPNPSLQGLSDDCLLHILPYLVKKDVFSLSRTCKSCCSVAIPYLHRNKSKKG